MLYMYSINSYTSEVIKYIMLHTYSIVIPLELSTPTGLGAFLSNSTLKSIGISLHSGGLYSYC